MARLNRTRQYLPKSYEGGGPIKRLTPKQELDRAVCACLLWEDQFYEDGQSIADRIVSLVPQVSPLDVYDLTITARENLNLRHVPLLLLCEQAKYLDTKQGLDNLIARVIKRPDEMMELLKIYWRDGRKPVSAQIKKGLAKAFRGFDQYQLTKYDRPHEIRLRDVLRICHPKPKDEAQSALWKLINTTGLPPIETWETELKGAPADKREIWTSLLKRGKIPAFALLKNLRNMAGVGVDRGLLIAALRSMRVSQIFPYRFLTAARYVPALEEYLEEAMFRCLEGIPKLPGRSVIVVDISGSMDYPVAHKSEVTRTEAAIGMAVLAREICEDVIILAFAQDTYAVPSRRGMALRDVIQNIPDNSATYLGKAVRVALQYAPDRIIVFTDEQLHDQLPQIPKGIKAYMINIGSYDRSVGYTQEWIKTTGWTPQVLRYIHTFEGYNEQFNPSC